MNKLLEFPLDKLFPCLDLYRIFLLHPDATCHFKKFEDGASHLYQLIRVLESKNADDNSKMLSLRCICNIFRD